MSGAGDAILFLQTRHRAMADLMEQRGFAVHRCFGMGEEEVAASPAAEATVLVASTMPAPTAAFLDRLPRLKLFHSPAAGYEVIDLDWCRRHDVAAAHVSGVNAPEVAEHAVGLALAAWRRIVANDRQVRAGEWRPVRAIDWPSFFRRTVGIVGMGMVGREIVRRLEPFGVELAWWGPRPKPDVALRRAGSLLELATAADILIVAARGGDDTRALVDTSVLDAIGPDGLLVNVARGSIVDEEALIAALRAGRLGAAAIDAYEAEPTPPERWRDVPNILLSPHTAGATRDSVRRLFTQAADDIAAFLAGGPLRGALVLP